MAGIGLNRENVARVALLNGLPTMLNHYEKALTDTVCTGGDIDLVSLDVRGIENTEGARARVQSGLSFLADARREVQASGADVVLNVWPCFGYLDAALWRVAGLGRPVVSILHDVTPLRAQFGYWPKAIGPLRLGSEGRHRWLVHTSAAGEVATTLGLGRPLELPHPVLPSQVQRSEPSMDVLVFGQYKPARDLELLADIGPELRASGLVPRIVGRGWPQIDGWEIEDRFVAEDEVQPLLADAHAVLVPYTVYYQSGVALRALESGTPVVGLPTTFLTYYFGEDWTGLVDDPSPQGWIRAIERARVVPTENVVRLAEEAKRNVAVLWNDELSSLKTLR